MTNQEKNLKRIISERKWNSNNLNTEEDLEFFDEEITQGFYEDLKSSPEDNKFYHGWNWC